MSQWQQYHQLLENERLVQYFADEIARFSLTTMKPDDVLRRFSLNGDGQLDLKEFQLAVKRMGIVASSDSADGSSVRARELFSVFCPSSTRKLEIDLFCRIMTEWSVRLLRMQQLQQQQQQQQQMHQIHRPSGSAFGRTTGGRTSPTRLAALATPYAIDPASRSILSSAVGTTSTEAEQILRRLSDPVTSNMEKLSQMFYKMDIACSGSVSRDEFELALSHIGVFLTQREYDKLYDALPLEYKDFNAPFGCGDGAGDNFGLRYATFLASFQQKPSNTQSSGHLGALAPAGLLTTPVVGHARLWDVLVASLDKLEPLFLQYKRIHQRYLSPENFRDCLLRCGVAMSTADFAALRVRLLPFCDSNGNIGLAPLLHALKAHDRSQMLSAVASSPAVNNPIPTGVSPIRTGRRVVFPNVGESVSLVAPVPHPAGKSNEQRNAEANRAIVKTRDENRWKSDLNFDTQQQQAHASSGEDNGVEEKQHALEHRILQKLQQLKEVGQLGSSSPQSVFPGDRFGRITRGQFRQSLVHLGVLARYAEVETLFWTLDPQGRGYIINHEFYDHLNGHASHVPNDADAGSWNLPSLSTDGAGSPERSRLSRPVQKVLEGMLHNMPALMAMCERFDPHRTGNITYQELVLVVQQVGILASSADLQTAVLAITQRVDPYLANSPESSNIDVRQWSIDYRTLEHRVAYLCSDLLSPKKRRKHLSTTSVLLSPQEVQEQKFQTEYNMNTINEAETLWNCPRRRHNMDHRATKTSVRIADQVLQPNSPRAQQYQHYQPAVTNYGSNKVLQETIERKQKLNRVALISILHDILERRSDLKQVMDLHRNADVHGHISKEELVAVLMSSRLSLNFTTASGVSAREFVEMLYPTPSDPQQAAISAPIMVGFLDLLHRISDLLAELTRHHPPGSDTRTAYSSPNSQQARRVGARFTHSTTPIYPVPGEGRAQAVPGVASFASDELSLRRKLVYESRLRDLLASEKGRQSAAILIRHAYKGLSSREMVVPIENGEYEAVCRSSDLKYVCYRLGLDLDVGELHFLTSMIDVNQSGYIASPQLLQYFVHLASAPSPTNGNGNSSQPKDLMLDMAASLPSPAKGLPRLIYPTAAAQQLVSPKDARNMNRASSGISGVLEALKSKIEVLEREIRADEKGKQEYDDQLFRLNKRREDLEAKLKESRQWIDLFESKIKPLEGKYGETTQSMQTQYDDAKLRHAQGIQVLIENFEYHPEFKRFSDTFSAVPFRPK
ncbi:TPA: hypothetical protein N0F65_004405 [Lagenidium giganteum]|uniref:EF-hand domain-containing protein n=1 Tax=Lagenidium giganteum TaxID=4803 RepID=A0AAV2ZBG9_9STRA|nr:TPA: hypothetical protein N0F65_004405 [Lagenidium giganteum]